ncbi:hypothetical protein D3C72_1922180 [compost metagenome]
MAVSSRRTSTSPRFTASPFSFRTWITTADTSARKSALRSGCTEPVMTGPDASALLWMVSMSSGETSRLTAAPACSLPSLPPLPGSLDSLPQAARAEAIARTNRVLRNMGISPDR